MFLPHWLHFKHPFWVLKNKSPSPAHPLPVPIVFPLLGGMSPLPSTVPPVLAPPSALGAVPPPLPGVLSAPLIVLAFFGGEYEHQMTSGAAPANTTSALSFVFVVQGFGPPQFTSALQSSPTNGGLPKSLTSLFGDMVGMSKQQKYKRYGQEPRRHSTCLYEPMYHKCRRMQTS